jgi:hypothetical protein
MRMMMHGRGLGWWYVRHLAWIFPMHRTEADPMSKLLKGISNSKLHELNSVWSPRTAGCAGCLDGPRDEVGLGMSD